MTLDTSRVEAAARASLRVAREEFPAWSHPRAPKKYRLPQIVACVLMKEWLGLDYRAFCSFLSAVAPLRRALGLDKAPHYSTLAYASQRHLTPENVAFLLARARREAPCHVFNSFWVGRPVSP